MKPGDRVRIHQPDRPWHGELATVVEADGATPTVLLELDRQPIGWRGKRAWFGNQHVRRLPREESK